MADIISIYPASVVASPADTDVVYGAADPAGTPADALFTISSLRQSLYPAFTAPVDGDYAWINQGGASVTVNANGSICLYAPATGDSLRVRKKAAPATPYTMTAGFMATGNQ